MNSKSKNFVFPKLLLLLLCLLLCSLCYNQSLSAQVTPNLFTKIDLDSKELSANQLKVLNTLRNDSTTITLQGVTLNIENLTRQKFIALNLSSNTRLTATRNKIESKGRNAFIWYGNVPGRSSNILLSVWDDAVFGFITVDTVYYNVHYLGDRFHALIQVDPNKYARCGTTADYKSVAHEKSSFQSSEPKSITNINSPEESIANGFIFSKDLKLKISQGNTVIDVLVAYTTKAKDGAINLGGINSLINSAIAAAEQSYNLSNISIDLQVVNTIEMTGYTENSAEGSESQRWSNG